MTIEIDASDLNLDNVERDIAEAIARGMGKIIFEAADSISFRTHEKKIGADGRSLRSQKDYSKSYKTYLESIDESTEVDLLLTGHLSQGYATAVQERGGKVEGSIFLRGGSRGDDGKIITNAEKVINLERLGWDFFRFDDKQKDKILQQLQKLIDKTLGLD